MFAGIAKIAGILSEGKMNILTKKTRTSVCKNYT